MPLYRKRPLEVEVRRWPVIRSTGGQIEPFAKPFHDWMGDAFEDYWQDTYLWGRIKTLEGEMKLAPGHWVVQGVKGEFYPITPEIFRATYEPLSDAPLEDLMAFYGITPDEYERVMQESLVEHYLGVVQKKALDAATAAVNGPRQDY